MPSPTPLSRRERLAVLALLLLAGALRMGWPGLSQFRLDEAHIASLALGIVEGREFPLWGTQSSVGVYLPPLADYLYALPLVLWKSPLSAVLFTGLLNLAGVVLTGTGRVSPALIALGRGIAKAITALYGRRHRSPLCHQLVFGTLNRPFKGGTGCEFISTDDAVIKAYAADEYCGSTVTAAFTDELLYGTRLAFCKETFENTPKDLPLFIGAGEFDTMGGPGLKQVKKDVSDYRRAGIADLEFHIYEGMRHEILNEKDKQRVYDDILAWLKKRVVKS